MPRLKVNARSHRSDQQSHSCQRVRNAFLSRGFTFYCLFCSRTQMTWAIQPYRTVLEAFCAQFRAARNADRNSVLDEIVKELREVEATEGIYSYALQLPFSHHFHVVESQNLVSKLWEDGPRGSRYNSGRGRTFYEEEPRPQRLVLPKCLLETV